MKRLVFIALSALILIPFGLQAQKKGGKSSTQTKGHNIVFNIKDAKDTMVLLAVYYRDKLILKDSTKASKPGTYIFKGDKEYQGGLYKLVSQKHYPYLDFIMDGSQNFTVNCDTTGNVKNVSYVNSPQNEILLAFQKKTVDAQKDMSDLRRYHEDAKKENNQAAMDLYDEKMKKLNEEMETYIWDLINANPDYLFSKMQRGYQQVTIPDNPTLPDGTVDSTFQARYFFTHYWDNIDLGDSRLIFTPVLEPKMKDYFGKWLQYQEPDTINKYVDMVLEKAEKDTLMYHYFVDWLAYKYESSKVLGHDGIFVHIVKNNHMKGKCTWLDEDILRKYEKRVKHLDPLLIGKKAIELVIPDTTLTDDYTKWHSSYRLPKRYTILWFFDPDCPTCKIESKKLRELYDSLELKGTRNFDVYAVANDSDLDRWKRYVKENNYPWINVGGNKGNVDYLEAYNIYESGNPAMFIIDNWDEHKIILNKRIEINTIPEFLQQYEKRFNSKK